MQETTPTGTSLPPKITKENIHTTSKEHGQIFIKAKTVVFLLLSSFLISLAAFSLIAPNNFTIGGVSGIAILIYVATHGAIHQSWLVAGLNLPLVILSFFFVKKRFAILSAANIVLQTIWMVILETCFPSLRIAFVEGGERIFAAMAGGICIGTAVALAFKIGGSTGGADIIVVMIQKKIAASSIAWLLFGLNCIVIGASFFVFYDAKATIAVNILPLMMSIFESYIESKINDSLTNGFQSAIEFRIITSNPEEMSLAIMRALGRGVTSLPAKGMYTKEERSMLVCVISKRQIAALRQIMKQCDPDSFAVMSSVSQVLGLGFYTGDL